MKSDTSHTFNLKLLTSGHKILQSVFTVILSISQWLERGRDFIVSGLLQRHPSSVPNATHHNINSKLNLQS